MSVFSVNQANQFYLVKDYASALPTSASTVGDAYFVKGVDGKIRLGYKGVATVSSSPSFKTSEIVYAKAKKSSELSRALKKYKVSLKDSLVAGQYYALRVAFRNFVGISEEDQYFKYGEVLATSSMTSEGFYEALKTSLDKNFSKEVVPLLSFSLDQTAASATMATNTGVTITAKTPGTSGNSIKFAIASVTAAEAGITVATVSGVTTITASLTTTAKTIGDLKGLLGEDTSDSLLAESLITISGTNATTVSAEATAVALTGGATNGLIVEELEQPWALGKFPQTAVNFTLQPLSITNGSGLQVIWGEVTKQSSTSSVANGKQIADLEYFLMGERGDIYRKISFPHNIDTSYLVDSTKEYHIVSITFAIKGNENEGVQGQQQAITIAVEKGSAGHEYDLVNEVIAGLNTVAGSTVIATLS